MVSADDFLVDPLELIAPLGTVMRVLIARSKIPFVDLVHYSSANPFIMGSPASPTIPILKTG